MGDVMDSLEVGRLEKEIQLEELKLNLKRMDLRRAQIKDELSRLEENYQATLKAVAELERKVNKNG